MQGLDSWGRNRPLLILAEKCLVVESPHSLHVGFVRGAVTLEAFQVLQFAHFY